MPALHPQPKRAHRGLTLIELSVTVSILVLTVGVAAPAVIRFQEASQLQWAARRTIALAGEARGLAVATDREVTLEYDPGNHGLRMAEGEREEQGRAGQEPPVGERRTLDARFLPLPYEVRFSIDMSNQVYEGALRFHPDGRSEPVQVRLERPGFPPIRLRMNARTGRLKIEEQGE